MQSNSSYKKTLLLSSAGRRVELLKLFREEAEKLGIELRIITTDPVPEWSPACTFSDKVYKAPFVADPSFIPTLLEICKKECVDLLVPTIDLELLPYAKNRSQFEAMGTRMSISDYDAIDIIRDKRKTMDCLVKLDIPVPYYWDVKEIDHIPLEKKLIAKPLAGSSSKGIMYITTHAELASIVCMPTAYIIQECLEGKEYTINMFINPDGKLISVVPHWRKLVRGGEVCFGQTEKLAVFDEVAQKLVYGLPGLRGLICFQAIITPEGRVGVFEINGRFGGGYPLAHEAGCKATRWLLQEICHLTPDYTSDWQSDLRMMRYDAAVFV